MFCAPVSLIRSFLHLVLLFQVRVSKISSVLLLNVVPLFVYRNNFRKLPIYVAQVTADQ